MNNVSSFVYVTRYTKMIIFTFTWSGGPNWHAQHSIKMFG